MTFDELKAMIDPLLPVSIHDDPPDDWQERSVVMGAKLNDPRLVSKEVRDQAVEYMIAHMERLFHGNPPHPLVRICIRECEQSFASLDEAKFVNAQHLILAARPFLTHYEAMYLGIRLGKVLNFWRAEVIKMIVQEMEDGNAGGGGGIALSA